MSAETGFACNKDKIVANGIGHIRPFNIGNDGALTLTPLYKVPHDLAPIQKSELAEGDILFNVTNSADLVGKTVLVRQLLPMAFSNHVARLRIDRTKVEPEWLAYWLRHQKILGTFRGQATQWVSQATFRTSQLRQMSLWLPSLDEQRRSVDLLSRAESIFRMCREAEVKAKEIIPALFVDMFGDPANPVRRGCDETSREALPVVRLGDLVSRFEGGKNVQAGAAGDSEYRILKISAVTSGEYDEMEAKPAPTGFHPPLHYFVQLGDLLFSRANTEELVGATALVENTDGKSLLPDKLWRFVWKHPEEISPVYMLALLQSPVARKELSKIASGTGGSMKNISQAKLAEMKVTIAPISEQKRFEHLAQRARAIASNSDRATAAAAATFRSLLAGVFGEGRTADREFQAVGSSR